ncbi:MAG: hypothetical protein R2751_12050 [Bacteroidales bacterium]
MPERKAHPGAGHNIEHNYYRTLARGRNAAAKLFFLLESVKLKRYERVLPAIDPHLAISETEQHHFQTLYGKTTWIPAFADLPRSTLPASGTGDYVLLHGNLSVAENREAVTHVIRNACGNPFPWSSPERIHRPPSAGNWKDGSKSV